jgi:hypothetical protein
MNPSYRNLNQTGKEKRTLKYLIIIVVILCVIANSAYAIEHSELSNVFTLDTRDIPVAKIPMEHSALSNVFTLDTRETDNYKITILNPDPNPSELSVMAGGIGYLYYNVVDDKGIPVQSVTASYKIGNSVYQSSPTNSDGLLVIPIEVANDAQPGTLLDFTITHIGSSELTNPIKGQVSVTQREYTKEWGLGSSISGKIGASIGVNAFVKAKTDAGISYSLNESDVLSVERSAEIGAGGGLGIKIPGAKLTIGAVKARVGAKAEVESIVYSTFTDKYSFPDRHTREQQMAQSALLIDTAMQIAGKPAPLAASLIQALMNRVTNYESYREEESVTLGTLLTKSAKASAGIELGSIGKSKSSPITGININGSIGNTTETGLEYTKFYKQRLLDASGYALNQEFGVDVEISALLGTGKQPDDKVNFAGSFTKDYVTASAGVDYGKSGFVGAFAKLGVNNLQKLKEKYIADVNDNPREFSLTFEDNIRAVTYTIAGNNISKIKQSVANLSAFIDVANNVNVNVGEKAIADEMTQLSSQLPNMEIKYTVTETRSTENSFPIDLEGNLGLDVGVSFEVKASENLENTVLEGVFLNGKLYPRSSYTDNPKSNAQLKSIVDDALKGSWEVVKEAFNQVKQNIVAGTKSLIEATAKVVEPGVTAVVGTAKLLAKFNRNVAVTLVTWVTPKNQPSPAPAKDMTAYQQALAQATAPVIGGYYQFTPEGEVLAEPGELTITYTDDEIAKLGVNEKSLRISYWDTEKSRWVSVGGKIDSAKNSVIANITALHLYAITFDSTPPDVGQLTPTPDSVITGKSTIIGADILDDTNQLDTSSVIVLLDGKEVIYNFDGSFVFHLAENLAIGKHNVTVKASDLFGNATEKTWSFTLRDSSMPRWDVDGNGVVDTRDLILVSNSFGKSGKGISADVNDDGIVNIVDLVIVSAHFGENTSQGAPSLVQMPKDIQSDILRQWIETAQEADDGSDTFKKGISVLKSLLNSMIPNQTALLNNYPNPFNPDTWIPYQLSEESDVSITIYDANGKIVKNLDLGHKSAGIYVTQDRSAHWDGKNEAGETVASGVYFVVLKAGKYQKTQRIVMIR